MAEKRACGSMDSRFRGNDDRVCRNILLHPIALLHPLGRLDDNSTIQSNLTRLGNGSGKSA